MRGLLLLAVLALVGLGLLTGSAGLGLADAAVLWELRAPRVVLAALVGGALGLSGAVLQGALRNPLADPALLGIGGAAGVGAVAHAVRAGEGPARQAGAANSQRSAKAQPGRGFERSGGRPGRV